MTQQEIQQLFQLKYDQHEWKQFLSQAFSDARFLSTPEVLTGINSDVATQALHLGYIALNENGIERSIAIYDVTLAPGIILERNRVGLRNLLRKYWKDIDAAFIVYHRPNSSTSSLENWRFTYVSELSGFDAEGELVKVKTEPKRYTYILGEGESCRTAAERFSIIAKKGSQTTLEDVKEAFSVEKLSKSFFDEYKEHYQNFVDFFTGKRLVKIKNKWEEKQTGKANSQLAYIFNGDEKAIRDFNKKLLGRIVFLYFIQKKGWMGVPEHSTWGQGDPNFLSNLFNKAPNKGLFYSKYLTRLFFDTLNSPRPNDCIELIEGEKVKIPFLNGGLFEEDNKKYRDLIFPAELFEKLFQFFNQYNFTIYEDDPNDHTVAVDPEMLGHIFENLLEDNKDKGAYYTPKEIVHYMCQESLIEYLTTWFESNGYEVRGYIGLDKPDQPRLFSANESLKGQLLLETPTQSKSKQIDRLLIEKLLKKKLDDKDKQLVKHHASEFHKALDKVKICDPAIGSGAFPMGLLKEIFAAKQTLYTFEHGNTEGFNASEIKLNIIQNSIYGVDIEKGAVDIARLRFWLSLVVDEEIPKALPNLDYKIVVGNSLVSKLDDDIIDINWEIKESTQVDLLKLDFENKNSDLLLKISKEQKAFFNPQSDKKKLANEIRNLKIDLLINQLELMVKTEGIQTRPAGNGKAIAKQTQRYMETLGWKQQIEKLKKLKTIPEEPLHFFEWKLDFPEVLNPILVNENAGFDIVIANPPYIKEYTNRDAFEGFKNSPYYQGKMDIWYGFACIMLDLLKPKGIECFIAQNNWITSAGASIFRKKILHESKIKLFTDFGNYKVFNSAGIQTMVYLIKKEDPSKNYITKYTLLKNDNIAQQELKSILEFGNFSKHSEKFLFKFNSEYFNGKSIYFNKSNLSLILDKIENNSNFQLSEEEVIQGIVGAPDEAFLIDKKNLKNFNTKEIKYIKPYYTNASGISNYYIIYLSDKNFRGNKLNQFSNLFEHFKPYKEELEIAKIKYKTPSKPYFYLHRERNESFFIKGEKIICQVRCKKPNFYYTMKEYYASRAVNIIKSYRINLKYLSLLLNSNLIYFFYKNRGASQGNILKFDKGPLLTIPIKTIENTRKFQTFFDELSKLYEEGKNTTILQDKINNLVYKLYELNYDEVKVIDPDFALSKEEYKKITME